MSSTVFTLQDLFGIAFRDIETLYVIDQDDLDETKHKVLSISICGEDKIIQHRQYPLVTYICRLNLLVLNSTTEEQFNIILDIDKLHTMLLSNILDVIFDGEKHNSLSIKVDFKKYIEYTYK